MTPMNTNDTPDRLSPAAGSGGTWCAMCGTMGDHGSGMCPELHPAISDKGEWLKCDSCGHVAFYEDTLSMCKGCRARTACRMAWPSDAEIAQAQSQNTDYPHQKCD
jgi:hypothetical protein